MQKITKKIENTVQLRYQTWSDLVNCYLNCDLFRRLISLNEFKLIRWQISAAVPTCTPANRHIAPTQRHHCVNQRDLECGHW